MWEILTLFGSTHYWLVFSAFLLVLLLALRALREHMDKEPSDLLSLILPSLLIANVTTLILKSYFQIPRPSGLSESVILASEYSFPSGHAATIFAITSSLSFYYRNKNTSVALLFFAAAVAYTRLVLGVHRLEDVLVGSLIGMIIGYCVSTAYCRMRMCVRASVDM